GHAISSIEIHGQVLRVVLGPDHPPEKWSLICDPEVGTPVDAVVLERDTREAEFVAGRPDYAVPKRARWWTPPSIEAALDTGQSALKLLSWRRLTRDSTLPFSDLRRLAVAAGQRKRSEEHTSELQSRFDIVCRLLLEKKNNSIKI